MANSTKKANKKVKAVKNPFLKSWVGLNAFLMNSLTNANDCDKLLKEELKGRRRPTFVLRIRSRYVKLRNIEERRKLRI